VKLLLLLLLLLPGRLHTINDSFNKKKGKKLDWWRMSNATGLLTLLIGTPNRGCILCVFSLGDTLAD